MLTEQDYLAWLQNGDQRGIAYFFNAHYVRLVYYADSIIKDREVAEEIVSNVFVGVWKRGRIFETAGGVVVYLNTAVRNRCYTYLKDRKRREGHKMLSDTMIDETVSINNVIRAELLDDIKKMMDTLPGRLQQVLHYSMEELTIQEIADKMGISPKTVHNHQARLRKLIYDKIKNRY